MEWPTRATFLVDPDGVIQFVMVTAGSVGRKVERGAPGAGRAADRRVVRL